MTSDDQLAQWWDWKDAPDHFRKAKCAPENCHGHCLVVCCPSDLLQLCKTITSEKYAQQINVMHWKGQHLQPALVNGMGPVLIHDNAWLHGCTTSASKVWWLDCEVLPHLPYSPDLSSANYHFSHFDNFWQGKMLPQPAEGRKCFPRVCGILKHGFLHYRNKQTYFLLAKCVDGNGSCFY